MNKVKGVLLSVAAVAVVGFTGCASITEGKNQPVSVNATCGGHLVTGAACTLSNDKGTWYATTPGSVVIHKSYQNIVVSCKDKGAAGTKTYKSSSNGGVWGNILAGGLIGYAIDRSDGAGFDYPSSMGVKLNGPCPGRKIVAQQATSNRTEMVTKKATVTSVSGGS